MFVKSNINLLKFSKETHFLFRSVPLWEQYGEGKQTSENMQNVVLI